MDNTQQETEILVLYYSKRGGTQQLARLIARGIEATGARAKLRTVPSLPDFDQPLHTASSPTDDLTALTSKVATNQDHAADQQITDPIVTRQDLERCHGLAFGSPVRFGNMAAPLKHFIDSTSKEWLCGTLIGKPAIVFSSGSMLHGGQETTLQSMMLPLLHHGMLILGIPCSEPNLHKTTSGGTPYGATHISNNDKKGLDSAEKDLAMKAGVRLAEVAIRLRLDLDGKRQ